MTFPNHFRIAFGGTFFTSEIWSCAVNMSDGGAATDIARIGWAETHIDDVKNHVETWFKYNTAGISNAARLTWAKVNAIGENGKYINQESNVWNYPAPIAPGTLVGAAHPWAPPQISLVVTLRSDLRAGRGSHGRVHLPCAQLDTANGSNSPYLNAGQALSVCTAFKDLVNLLNGMDVLPPSPKVCIVSQSTDTKEPMTTDVTRVQIGNAFDTMQSRRNRLRESYQTVDL